MYSSDTLKPLKPSLRSSKDTSDYSKRLVLIDGKSVFYRGYYAMGALSLADGTPTGGVYGFAAIAMEIVERLKPSKVVVAWDSRSSVQRRRRIFVDYKAGRVKPGEDFYAQIPLLKELIADLGWSFIEVDEYEADDIIGTLSRQADEAGGWETFIISSDLDMLQIVDDNTHMWRILKGFSNIEQIDVKEVEEKYGIKKSQFLDLKALKGDASDNIPGVPGVGEKTAAKLLNEYGSLDGVYEHIDEIKGSVQKKLIEGKELAYMSYSLAKIMFDAPVALSEIPDFEFNSEKVINGLKKLEFNSLIRKFGKKFENNAFEEHISRRGKYGATEARDDGPEGAFRERIISSNPTIVILGPTGSGKTGISIKIAKALNGEIISADSRAIYKGMNIGTAKPTKEEMQNIPHFGLDLVEPGERFTVADWKQYAEAKIEEIKARNHAPIIVGGTGLYIDALIYDYQFKGSTGAKIGDFEQKSCSDRTEVKGNFLLIGVNTETEVLRTRLKQRIDQMFRPALYDETKRLTRTYSWNSQAMKSNIYIYAHKFLTGELTLDQAKEQCFYRDWHLAKRQITWFKRNPKIIWLKLEEIYPFVLKYNIG